MPSALHSDDDSSSEPDDQAGLGFVAITSFEFALIFVAILIGRWFEFDPRHDLLFADEQTGLGWKSAIGLLATLPMFGFLVLVEKSTWKPLEYVRHFMEKNVVPWIAPLPFWQLALIGIAAGVGEEMLFRGAIQHLASQWMGITLAIILGGALFGLAHFATWWYALLAGLTGVYFGWLFYATGSLVSPVVAHAFYDIVALCYLARKYSTQQP